MWILTFFFTKLNNILLLFLLFNKIELFKINYNFLLRIHSIDISSIELLPAVPFISRLPHSSLYISRNLSVSFSLNSFRWPSFTFFFCIINKYERIKMIVEKRDEERNYLLSVWWSVRHFSRTRKSCNALCCRNRNRSHNRSLFDCRIC